MDDKEARTEIERLRSALRALDDSDPSLHGDRWRDVQNAKAEILREIAKIELKLKLEK